MADAIGSLFIDLSMQTASFDAATKRVEAQVKGLSSKISAGFSTLKGVAASALVIFGGQAVGAVKSWAESMAAAGEEAENLATTLGLTLRQVVQLQGVFELTTGSLGEAQAAMLKMNGAVADALGGSREAIENFRAIGISLQDLARVGNDPMEMLKLLADRFTEYENNAAKSAAFFDIFGKGWSRIAPALAGGRDEIDKLIRRLKELNPSAEDAANAGSALDRKLDELGVAVKGVANEAFAVLNPLLLQAASDATTFAINIRTAISAVNDFLAPLGGLANALREISSLGLMGMVKGAVAGDMNQVLRAATGGLLGNKESEAARVQFNLPPVNVTAKPSVGKKNKGGGGGGGGESEAVKEWKEAVELMKEMAEEAKDASIAMAEGMQDVGDEVFRRRVLQIKNLLELEKITGREAVDAERKVVEEKWAAHQEFFAKKREAAEGDKKEIARINREEATERERHLTELQQLDHDKTKLRFDQLKDAALDLGNVLENSFSNAFDSITEGTFKLRTAIGGLLKDLGRMLASKAFQMLLNGGGTTSTGGGLLGSLFGMFMGGGAKTGGGTGPFGDGWSATELGIPGFAHGGSFRVGGSGGIDSQLVAFHATPNEHVTVTPPGQGGGGTEVIRIELNPNEGWVSGIADQRIVTATGQIVRVSVAQSTKAVQRNFGGYSAEAQARQL